MASDPSRKRQRSPEPLSRSSRDDGYTSRDRGYPPRDRDDGRSSSGRHGRDVRDDRRGVYEDRKRSTSPGPSHARRQDEGYRSRDQGYNSRDAGGEGSGGRYDPRGDRPSGGRGGGHGGDRGGRYTTEDRERERRTDRERYGRDEDEPEEVKKSPPKPNYGNSGLLAAAANTVHVSSEKAAAAGAKAGEAKVVLKYHEPPEARKPTRNWRLYVFKGSQELAMIPIHAQSSYLFGRDKLAVEIPIEHPSASKQHAVIQYRQMTEKNEFGDTKTAIKPFIIDLDSTNGTFVNDQEIPASRYYELRASDVIKFAQSAREYVLLHEESGA